MHVEKYQMEPDTLDKECSGTTEAKYKTVLANFAENIIGLGVVFGGRTGLYNLFTCLRG